MGRKQSSSSSSFWHPRRRCASAPATPRTAAEPPLGCMSMVHYLIFAPGAGCVGRPPTASNAVAAVVAPPRDTMNYHEGKEASRGSEKRGGLEAPRNSLDMDADNINGIPIGVQIEPVFDALACRKMRSKATAPSSEAETPRTPSLVARLMGIDGLPENNNNSPSPANQLTKKNRASAAAAQRKEKYSSSSPASSTKEKKKRVIPESISSSNRREALRSLSCNVSLAESPRASWDGARLSLQALKENVLERAAQYMSLPTSPTSGAAANGKNTKKKKNSKKERMTAKEIVRQAKEAVANRNKDKQHRFTPSADAGHDNKENVMSPAQAVRKDRSLLAQERRHHQPPPPTNKRVALAPKNPPPPPPPHRAKPSRPPPPPPPIIAAKKPDGCERFATRIKKPAATSSSPVTPPGPAARSPPPQSSSSMGHVARSLLEDPEYGYLRKVLERGGFLTRSGRPFKGHSVSSPVDPIVFHLLELELPAEHEEARLGPLRHRWNRKLMFHLAQEILADLLLASSAPPARGKIMATGGPEGLLTRVWHRVRSFPAADCRVVGDIDALVAMDLRSPATVRRLGQHPAVLEEASDVAEDVADQVLDTLLQECLPLQEEEEQESLSLSSGR